MIRTVKTLLDVLPLEFSGGEYFDSRAWRLRDVEVSVEHDRDPWPGAHKNVSHWYELVNGCSVGWNESPSRGWSFPVVKTKRALTAVEIEREACAALADAKADASGNWEKRAALRSLAVAIRERSR